MVNVSITQTKCKGCGHHIYLHKGGPCRFFYIGTEGNRTECGCGHAIHATDNPQDDVKFLKRYGGNND